MDRHPSIGRPERPETTWDSYDSRLNGKARLDQIRLRSHRLIAQKIDAEPSLLDIPLRNLDRWRELRGEDHPACAEWRKLLKLPWAEVRALIVADTEESTRLRLSTPFAGVLSQRERWRLHETTRA